MNSNRFLEFKFPFIIIKSRGVLKIFDLASRSRHIHWLGWLFLLLMPITSSLGIYFLISSAISVIQSPAVREVSRELGPQAYLLLPGLNPYLPILYGWISIAIAIAVHELSHGIIASRLGLNVRSAGLLLLLGIPIGAFVEIDEEQLKSAKLRNSLRVLSSGPSANILVAIISLLLLILLVNGLSPAIDGLYVLKVEKGMPAQLAGLMEGDVIIAINGSNVLSIDDLKRALESASPSSTLILDIARGEGWGERLRVSLRPIEVNGSLKIGVYLAELSTTKILNAYRMEMLRNPLIHFMPPSMPAARYFIPFSDAMYKFYDHPLGQSYVYIANVLFWIWFVNVNVGIFNALPIYPLDGGQALYRLLRSIVGSGVSESVLKGITGTITASMLMLIIGIILLPYLIA